MLSLYEIVDLSVKAVMAISLVVCARSLHKAFAPPPPPYDYSKRDRVIHGHSSLYNENWNKNQPDA